MSPNKQILRGETTLNEFFNSSGFFKVSLTGSLEKNSNFLDTRTGLEPFYFSDREASKL